MKKTVKKLSSLSKVITKAKRTKLLMVALIISLFIAAVVLTLKPKSADIMAINVSPKETKVSTGVKVVPKVTTKTIGTQVGTNVNPKLGAKKDEDQEPPTPPKGFGTSYNGPGAVGVAVPKADKPTTVIKAVIRGVTTAATGLSGVGTAAIVKKIDDQVDTKKTETSLAQKETTSIKTDNTRVAERTTATTTTHPTGGTATNNNPSNPNANPNKGKSCGGDSTSIASGAWAQTGGVFDDKDPKSRACVRCVDGKWETKETKNCNTVAYIARPDQVIAGQTNNKDKVGPKAGCWKDNTWYADDQSTDNQHCSQGHWCGGVATWNGSECVMKKVIATTVDTSKRDIMDKCPEMRVYKHDATLCPNGVQEIHAKSDCTVEKICQANSTTASNAAQGITNQPNHPISSLMTIGGSTMVGGGTGCAAGFAAGALLTVPLGGVGAPLGCAVGGAIGSITGYTAGNYIDDRLPSVPPAGVNQPDHPAASLITIGGSTMVGGGTGCAAGFAAGALLTVPLGGVGAPLGCAVGGLIGSYGGFQAGRYIDNR